MTLHHLDHLREGLLDCPAERLLEHLDGPTWIELDGDDPRPLFVSTLLHGNEVSGWNGLRRFLAETPRLAHRTAIFIGNPHAAAARRRVLPGEADYNRIWRLPPGDERPEAALVGAVRDALARERWFAAIDLHNNTGHNPHYAVLTDPAPSNLGLARLFADRAVLVEEPDTVLTRVFDGLCPALTLELGPIHDPGSDERCRDYLERCFALQRVPTASRDELMLYRALARVHVAESAAFRFAGDETCERDAADAPPLLLTGGVEGVNFHQLVAGFEFGSGRGSLDALLRVLDVEQRDVTHDYLELVDGRIRLRRAVTPAMYTTDPLVVRQDCLCYLMEALPGE